MGTKFIIGIDLGGTNLKIALFDLRCNTIEKRILSTKNFLKKESLIFAIMDSVKKIVRDNNLETRNILGVGLGLPGPIDVKKGIVHFFPNIPGWKKVKLKNILSKKLKLPVFLDNDANLMCLAEYTQGAAKGFKNVICLTLGTGVGGGIIVEKKLYRGSNFAAGEIGHMPINENGPKCNCGGIACLESYIGNNAILREAKKRFGKKITLEELSSLANKKNRLAKGIWQKVGRRLGVALTGVVNLLNPDAVVIGGGVANAGRILFDTVRKAVKSEAMPVQAKQVKILKAKLGNDAGLIGAAILVKQQASIDKIQISKTN